ncbi:MAG: type II secretion system GspH family protein [Puniceicoccales bacterium]|nr:type II secretion system GspH family protein [Puniceicoccales bacterium]
MEQNKRGFTLIEVLAVIAIISILATLLTPSIGGLLARARRARAMNNMRQIAIAYQNYANGGGSPWELRSADCLWQWAGTLARQASINDGAIYIFPDDYLVERDPRPAPKSIGRYADGNWEVDEAFRSYPLSVTVIAGIASDAPPSTTPLAYTRGLDPEMGHWRKSTGASGGVYGERGGLVVFLDGHVEFFEFIDPKNPPFFCHDSGLATVDIRRAVNPGARALSWNGVDWEN